MARPSLIQKLLWLKHNAALSDMREVTIDNSITQIIGQLSATRRAVWKLPANVSTGGLVALPDDLFYLPGYNAVFLSYMGICCHLGSQFEETGIDVDGLSHAIRLSFPARKGDEVEVVIRGHGPIDPPDATGLSAESGLDADSGYSWGGPEKTDEGTGDDDGPAGGSGGDCSCGCNNAPDLITIFERALQGIGY